MNDLLLPAIQKSGQDSDPYYNLVSLHLKGDVNTGRDYNAFSDASSNQFRLTNNGDVRGSSFSPYGTSWSSYMAAASLTTNYNSKINVGANSFVVEMFVYITSYGSGSLLWNLNNSGSERGYNLEYGSTGAISISASTNGTTYAFVATTTDVVPLNQWVHIVWTRDQSQGSNNTRLFFNGVLKYVGTFTGTQASVSTRGPNLGFTSGSGYLSNVRLINGSIPTDYQTSSTTLNAQIFQVTTSPLTAVTNTAFLALQSNRFIDNSSTPLTISINTGSPSISSFSPFLETDTTTGSGYFDGSGDYLTFTDSSNLLDLGGVQASIDFWFYRTSAGTDLDDFIIKRGPGAGWSATDGIEYIIIQSSNQIVIYYNTGGGFSIWNTGITITNFQWNHLCVATNTSNNISVFLNGTTKATSTFSIAKPTTRTTVNIGVDSTADANYFTGYMSGLRFITGANAFDPTASSITVPTAPLTAITNTSLLTLQERGAYNTIGFQDESEYQHVITRNGNVAQGTFSPFSQTGWSTFVGGAGYQRWDTNTNYSGTDLTIECWAYATAATTTYTSLVSSNLGTGNYNQYFGLAINGSNQLTGSFFNSSNVTCNNTVSFPLNQWVHCAVVLTSAGAVSLYQDGQRVATASSAAIASVATGIQIGGLVQTSGGGYTAYFNGYISNARIVKSPVYSGTSYNVPSSPLTAITNTNLLVCQSNRALDNSGNNYTTGVNTVSRTAVAFSPFAPVAYDPAVHGGSGYFDGNGDSLSLTATQWLPLGTEDFTIDFWFYLSSWPGSFSNFISGSANNSLSIYYNSTDQDIRVSFVGVSALLLVSRSLINLNSWNHYALVRSSNNWSVWINGTRRANTTNTSSFVQSAGSVGSSFASPLYLSSLRIVRGSAVYDPTQTNITPPSGPLPILPNTSLLLNFTNAGVIDSTGKNVIETVGNAGVVTTATKKYGSGSMFFSGTNPQHLLLNHPTGQNALNAAFTIEFWVYWISGVGVVVSSDEYPSLITILSNGKIEINVSTSPQSTGTISANTWTHLAFTRNSSGVWTLYINGSADALSLTNTSTYTLRRIGGRSSDYCINGNLDDVRITRGLARYTANFTPPTKALPDRGTASTLTTDMAAPSSVEYLVVAGGGGAGGDRGGGGGAGGFRTGTGLSVTAGTDYTVTVGAAGSGGAPGNAGGNGSNSVFSTITSNGGGGGGGWTGSANNGGSGGGAGGTVVGYPNSAGSGNTPASSSPPDSNATQGNNGGICDPTGGSYPAAGGGGGASATGTTGTYTVGGAGGAGTASSITGSSVFYAGGGGGGIDYRNPNIPFSAGGAGGGGTGQGNSSGGTAGSTNTGGGGGGSNWTTSGNAGGSGVVIIAYPTFFRPLKASLGLVYTIDTVTRPGYRVYRFTAGTGNIYW